MGPSGRIFITGGAGFIGRTLAKRLVHDGYQVICFDLGEQFYRYHAFFEDLRKSGQISTVSGTILDRNQLATAMRGAQAVFHMAAMLGVRRTEENRLRCLDININGTDNVLSACVRNRVTHVIVASSSEVYGEPSHNPIQETDETKGKTVYAVSKLAAEELTKGYNQLHPELSYTIVRLFNTYGEGQVAQFVMSRFVSCVLDQCNPVVYGSGDQVRSYGHVDDVVEGLLTIMRNAVALNKTYNLGNSTQVYSLKALAQKVIDIVAPDRNLRVEIMGCFEGTDRSAEREIFARYCDTRLAQAELSYRPKITVEEGIRRIAAHKERHFDWPFSA